MCVCGGGGGGQVQKNRKVNVGVKFGMWLASQVVLYTQSSFFGFIDYKAFIAD